MNLQESATITLCRRIRMIDEHSFQEPPMDDEQSNKLLFRIRNRDGTALGELWEATYVRLFNALGRYTRDVESIEAAVSDAFMAVLEKPSSLGECSGFGACYGRLFVIASRKLFDQFRRGRRLPSITLDSCDPPSTPDRVSEPLEQQDLKSLLSRALITLHPFDRTLIIQKDVDGLTYPQLSESTGLSETALKSRLYRARLELREFLEANASAEILPRLIVPVEECI